MKLKGGSFWDKQYNWLNSNQTDQQRKPNNQTKTKQKLKQKTANTQISISGTRDEITPDSKDIKHIKRLL